MIEWGDNLDSWLSDRLKPADQPEQSSPQQPPLLRTGREEFDIRGSRIILTPTIEAQDSQGLSVGLKLRARIELPRVSKRIKLIFDSDYDETDLTPEIVRQRDVGLRGDEQPTANLEVDLPPIWKFKMAGETGLKFKPEPQPRFGLRGRLSRTEGEFELKLTQKFFWEGDEGFGERTTLALEQCRKGVFLRRLSTSVLWSESSDGVQGGSTLQMFRYLGGSRALGVSFGANGPLEPEAHVETYSARISFKRRVHRDWLFFEVEPGIDWEREHSFKPTYIVRAKFDLIFGDWFNGSDHR